MLYVFLSIFVGVAVGLALKDQPTTRNSIMSAARPLILLLLLVLGMSLGAEHSIWRQLGAFAWSATVLAVTSVAGSIAVSSLYQLIPRRKHRG